MLMTLINPIHPNSPDSLTDPHNAHNPHKPAEDDGGKQAAMQQLSALGLWADSNPNHPDSLLGTRTEVPRITL